MDQFPHLKFVQKITGTPRLTGGGGQSERTTHNKSNRQQHANNLSSRTNLLSQGWVEHIESRAEAGLPELDAEIIPIFLKVNPAILVADFDLENFGIEIISEEDDGFIVGASFDGLLSLKEKIRGFIEEKHGTGKLAELWEIVEGNNEDWKPQHILSKELLDKWNEIDDDQDYELEIGVAFARPIGAEPDRTKHGGQKRWERYQQELIDRDEQMIEREQSFESFVNYYGHITSSLISVDDSFSCTVKMNGKGLKDLVNNYPYVFDVRESVEITGTLSRQTDDSPSQFEIEAPDENASEIGIIDSGIMEQHNLLQPAIKTGNSKSYVSGDTSTADLVAQSGHGTKVAGASLYPRGISHITGVYKLPFFLRNLRILDSHNRLIHSFPAGLMETIVTENMDCNAFNMSVNASNSFPSKHMSAWAAAIDSLSHKKRKLFVLSAGNIESNTIINHIINGRHYPNYLDEYDCKIAEPGQSLFSLVVGSVNHLDFEDQNWKQLGMKDDVSGFSRNGIGIWGSIKPDVVEYGGGIVELKGNAPRININENTSIELTNSTLYGSPAVGRNTNVGTSYAAPKVSHIVGQLMNLYPDEDVNLIRGLVAQGATLPNGKHLSPSLIDIKQFGYGIPSLDKVTRNTERRITFYNTNELSAEEGHIYSLKIPENLRDPGSDVNVLIEVSLTFTADIRRTRQKTKSYLSSWLDWVSSRLDESSDSFSQRAIKELVQEEENENESNGVIQWMIRENRDWGQIDEISRTNSSLQKDWAIVKSHSMPEELCFSVRGHKGWDKNKPKLPYAFIVSIEAIDSDIPVYESVRLENEIEIEV